VEKKKETKALSGGELRFYSPSLRDGGRSLSEVGRQLESQWRDLEANAQGMGDIFGDDDVGSLIATTYRVAQQLSAQTHRSAARGFDNFGSGLHTMADDFERSERHAQESVTKVGRTV
jgi:hypothetical protein